MKLAVVGGGSTYTPELVDGIARLTGDIKITELVLVDPDAERLSVVGPFSARIMARYGHPASCLVDHRPGRGLDGAGAVLLQLRVGGQATRHRDETWPLECGCIGQETTGAGGFAKALRTVPVVLDVAERVRQRAAAGRLDHRLHQPGRHRHQGAAGRRPPGDRPVQRGDRLPAARSPGCSASRRRPVALDHVGLNHLTWERAALVDGMDRLPDLLAAHGEEIAAHTGLPLAVTRDVGAVPSYYLRYFWAHDAVVEEERGRRPAPQAVAEIERQLLAMYADPALDTKPELLSSAAARSTPRRRWRCWPRWSPTPRDRQVVNVRNNGTLPFLADEAVIEVSATIGASGAVPVPVAPVSPLMSGLIAHVSAYEELARGRGAARRPGPGCRGAAGPPAGRAVRPGREADRPAARRERARSCPGPPASEQHCCRPARRGPGHRRR